jgi:HK97 family phage major capsid protein
MKNRSSLLMLAALAFIGALAFTLTHYFGCAVGGTLAMAMAAPIVMTEDQAAEFKSILEGLKGYKDLLPGVKDLGSIEGGFAAIKALPAALKEHLTARTALEGDITKLKKQMLMRGTHSSVRRAGFVTDSCAADIASSFILHCDKSGMLEALASTGIQRDALMNFARSHYGLSVTKDALTTSEIPLPVQYGGEVRELISDFGVIRNKMFPYPIGMGTSRPARMGTRPAFGSIAMSGAFTEKSPTITFASLESHKLGGIVRLPRELDEQSIVAMGQFLARYGAVEFARAEDTWGFLADGTATYESISGICKIAADNSKVKTLAAGKTKPSDATIDDFRALRRLVNKAALSGNLSAYYLDTTWETFLMEFNTEAQPFIYVRRPDGSATLDGYPIVWTDVLQAYQDTAAASSYLAVFGALSFWWFGEHGAPRIDTSSHVWFANDQLAVRFIEEIDFDYCAVDAVAALKTAA